MTATYFITFTVRRWGWLPWPTRTFTVKKETTWQAAYEVATKFAEAGAKDVAVGRVEVSWP